MAKYKHFKVDVRMCEKRGIWMETFKCSYAHRKGREEPTKCYRKSQRKEFWKKGMIHSVKSRKSQEGKD